MAAVLVLAISLVCIPVSATASGSTVTIDGTDYDVVFSDSTGYVSTGSWWNQYDEIWDSTFINALNTDNAVLVFVRDTDVSSTTDGADTLQLVGSSWADTSGAYPGTIILGTCLTTTKTEDSTVALDCLSDDGKVVMYDAKSVYALWTAMSYESSTVSFIASSNASYNITNVYILTESATSTPSYLVSVDSVTGGTVTSSATKAKADETVTLTVSSDSSSKAAYRIADLTVTDENGAPVELTNNYDGTYTFTMPASGVTVTPVFEESGFRYFYVNGIKIQDVLDYTVNCGSGTAVFDPTTNTLTLTDATITTFLGYSSTYPSGIYVSALSTSAVPDGLTIEIVGDNYITGDGGSKGYCIYSSNVSTNIVGVDGGTLTLSNTVYGLNFATSSVSYNVSDCTITATSLTNSAINASGTTTISNSTITVSDSERGIYATGALTIDGCVITMDCTATSAYGGIYSTNTKTGLAIIDSNITLSSGTGYNSLYARILTVSGGSTVIANGGYSTTSTTGNITLSPESGYEMSVLVGTSESDATASLTATTDTTVSTGYTDYYYKNTGYTYFAIIANGPYEVTAENTVGGTIDIGTETTYKTGDTITFTITLSSGYSLVSVSAVDASGADVAVTDNGDGTYSFTMPASTVTLSATYNYSGSNSSTSSSISGIIYVNELYHGIFIDGNLVVIAHTVDADGYCTGCGVYVGTETDETEAEEEEAEVTEETVDIAEPVEDTDTEAEPDDEEEEEVPEVTETTETNPTTGAMLALLPMTIAGLAAAISKRR